MYGPISNLEPGGHRLPGKRCEGGVEPTGHNIQRETGGVGTAQPECEKEIDGHGTDLKDNEWCGQREQ